ncbi:alpha/beta fold hydrolase [Celerinatantimonas sp. YJH-8]|uniref:alpha/beta fold hydrolase n=1 Tax=Celerinatantimonas sp. YJH-8 TaxID=3228714 RepID=UPI0038C7124A
MSAIKPSAPFTVIDFFEGELQQKVSYAHTRLSPSQHALIVFAIGRSESALKYQKLTTQLQQAGFDVVLCDHRGQGASQRFNADPLLGDVDSFDYYVSDLKTLFNHLQLERYSQRFLLGHSMGGAIATLYLNRYPQDFSACTLSAPMFGIQLPDYLPRHLAYIIAKTLAIRDQSRHQQSYAPSQKNLQWPDFSVNPLTHSQTNYLALQELFKCHPNLLITGVSNRWLTESFRAMAQIARLPVLTTPILLLTPLADPIVSIAAQQRFIQKQPNSQQQCFKNAFHELFIESDPDRQQAIQKMITFYNDHRRESVPFPVH